MTILLIRHGSAGDPYRWSGDDADRPLDAAGADQADRLADKVDDLLAGRPLAEVRSSRAVRCLQTVGPSAARHDLLPEADPSLFEGSWGGRGPPAGGPGPPTALPTGRWWCCAATPTSSPTWSATSCPTVPG